MEGENKFEKPRNYGLPQELVDRVFRNLEREHGVDDGREEDWPSVERAIVVGEKINMTGRGTGYEFDVLGVNKDTGEIKVIDNSTRKVYFLRASDEAVRRRRIEAAARAAWSAAQAKEDERLSSLREKALITFITTRGLVDQRLSAAQVRAFPPDALAALPGVERMSGDSFLRIERLERESGKGEKLQITYFAKENGELVIKDMWEFAL